jgi:hypothetical protein
MSPGNRPIRASIGIDGAAQITNPQAATVNPITTIAFPNGAMAMHPITQSMVPARGANRDWGKKGRLLKNSKLKVSTETSLRFQTSHL